MATQKLDPQAPTHRGERAAAESIWMAALENGIESKMQD
jgi:hypothetical protein